MTIKVKKLAIFMCFFLIHCVYADSHAQFLIANDTNVDVVIKLSHKQHITHPKYCQNATIANCSDCSPNDLDSSHVVKAHGQGCLTVTKKEDGNFHRFTFAVQVLVAPYLTAHQGFEKNNTGSWFPTTTCGGRLRSLYIIIKVENNYKTIHILRSQSVSSKPVCPFPGSIIKW